jgi:hypothetical protein
VCLQVRPPVPPAAAAAAGAAVAGAAAAAAAEQPDVSIQLDRRVRFVEEPDTPRGHVPVVAALGGGGSVPGAVLPPRSPEVELVDFKAVPPRGHLHYERDLRIPVWHDGLPSVPTEESEEEEQKEMEGSRSVAPSGQLPPVVNQSGVALGDAMNRFQLPAIPTSGSVWPPPWPKPDAGGSQ